MKNAKTTFFIIEKPNDANQNRFDTKVIITKKVCRDLSTGIAHDMQRLSRVIIEEVRANS